MIGFSESDFLYPNTFFINDNFNGPYECNLARAVCVADFLADGNATAREWFSAVAAVEFFASDPTRQERIDAAADHVGDLLAHASFAQLLLAKGDRDSESPGFDPKALEKKQRGLREVWELTKSSPLNTASGPDEFPGGIGGVEGRMAARYRTMDIYDLGNAILYLDFLRLQPVARSGARPSRRDSVFREAILRSETLTGVIVFDECFDTIRDQAIGGRLATGLAEVEAAWKRWHTEDFLPADYVEARASHLHDRLTKQDHDTHVLEAWNRFREGSQRWSAIERQLGKNPEFPTGNPPGET